MYTGSWQFVFDTITVPVHSTFDDSHATYIQVIADTVLE